VYDVAAWDPHALGEDRPYPSLHIVNGEADPSGLRQRVRDLVGGGKRIGMNGLEVEGRPGNRLRVPDPDLHSAGSQVGLRRAL
jgi:hypothetical protein